MKNGNFKTKVNINTNIIPEYISQQELTNNKIKLGNSIKSNKFLLPIKYGLIGTLIGGTILMTMSIDKDFKDTCLNQLNGVMNSTNDKCVVDGVGLGIDEVEYLRKK